jgi:AcrR family transcriptional regulator
VSRRGASTLAAVTPEAVTDEEELRAADGRVPGRRGRATRQRLLECTLEMLKTSSYRDLKVVDIAREAGTSPATFYQYFPDVESAVLVLADEMTEDRARFAAIVRDTKWRGRHGFDGALALADEFLSFWDDHQPILRVVDLATEEGDLRFRQLRTTMLNEVHNLLADAIAQMKQDGRHPDEVEPQATSAVLVAMLAHVSAHRYGMEFWGIRTKDLRVAMARIIYWSIAGQKPPLLEE